MASCTTTRWATGAPYVKLVVAESASTTSVATLTWRLYYVAETAASATENNAFTVTLDGATVYTSVFDVDGKVGTFLIAAGNKNINRATTSKTVNFGVSFAFNLIFNSSYVETLSASGSLTVTPNIPTITMCGTPSNLSVVDNGNNTVTLSCKIGTNGTNNIAEAAIIYLTCDGTAPTADNFVYKHTLFGAANTTVSKTVSFSKLADDTMIKLLGSDYTSEIKCVAQTAGECGNSYYSAVTGIKSTAFTWYGRAAQPQIITPSLVGETTGLLYGYKVQWAAGDAGVNNATTKYSLRVYDVTTSTTVATYSTTDTYFNIPASVFTADHRYKFFVKAIGTRSNIDSNEAASGILTIKSITKFPSITLVASDGNTVPSLDLLNDKVYVDIGSGTVAKLSWATPTATNNDVDYYKINLSAFEPETNTTVSLYNGAIGNINEFYITSDLLSSVSFSSYQINAYLTAYSKYGTLYGSTSGTIVLHISKGCCNYFKVENDFPQPVLKRAVAFAKLDCTPLTGDDGKIVTGTDGKVVYTKVANVQDSDTGWTLMQEFYAKNSAGDWQSNDTKYELLLDMEGNSVTDTNNSFVYTL